MIKEKTYNTDMDPTEFLKDSGIYKIPKKSMTEATRFFRNTKAGVKVIIDGDEVAPLLHICERELSPYEDFYIVMGDPVFWDQVNGHYQCRGCKQTFYTREDLIVIWSDGYGTGEEGRC